MNAFSFSRVSSKCPYFAVFSYFVLCHFCKILEVKDLKSDFVCCRIQGFCFSMKPPGISVFY